MMHAMGEGVRGAAQQYPRLTNITFYDAPLGGDVQGRDYDHAGSVDIQRVRDQEIKPNADYLYLRPAAVRASAAERASRRGGPTISRSPSPLESLWTPFRSRQILPDPTFPPGASSITKRSSHDIF